MNRTGMIGLGLAGIALAGCMTTQGASQEHGQLRTQVTALQSQVAALDSQVNELRDRQQTIEERAWDQGQRVAPTPSAAKRPHVVLTAKEIQLALQRAGYYQGPIDGKIGAKTRTAIKAFQSANNLVADGVAGAKTMVALQAYLTESEP